jgi:Family of unknown function (DUF6812)
MHSAYGSALLGRNALVSRARGTTTWEGFEVQTKKDKTNVVMWVGDWRIEGDLHVLQESRLTDALNSRSKDFLAVTDATIFDARTGEELKKTSFLDVNRTAITVVHIAE